MKKKMTALLLTVVVVITVGGCASESSTDNPVTGLTDSTAGSEQNDSNS